MTLTISFQVLPAVQIKLSDKPFLLLQLVRFCRHVFSETLGGGRRSFFKLTINYCIQNLEFRIYDERLIRDTWLCCYDKYKGPWANEVKSRPASETV